MWHYFLFTDKSWPDTRTRVGSSCFRGQRASREIDVLSTLDITLPGSFSKGRVAPIREAFPQHSRVTPLRVGKEPFYPVESDPERCKIVTEIFFLKVL